METDELDIYFVNIYNNILLIMHTVTLQQRLQRAWYM